MKILVTGANGFLGRHVVAALLEHGHQVRALVRPAAALDRLPWRERVEVFRADLRGGTDLAPALEGVGGLAHLATTMRGDDATVFAASVAGTENLLAAVSAAGDPKRLVLASSFSVYDWTSIRGVMSESSPLLARPFDGGAYAAAKLWQERLFRRHASAAGAELVVLRPGFVWGSGSDDPACVGFRPGGLELVLGPMRRLPLVHVENCADAFRTALERPEAAGRTFNVVDPERTSAWAFARERRSRGGHGGIALPLPYLLARIAVGGVDLASRAVFGSERRLPTVFTPVRFALRFRPVEARPRLLERVLGWKPPLSFRRAVRETWPQAERAGHAAVETA